MNESSEKQRSDKQDPDRLELEQELARRLVAFTWSRHWHDAYGKGEKIWFTFPQENKRFTNFFNTYLKPLLLRFNYWAFERYDKKKHRIQRKEEARRLLSDPVNRERLRNYLVKEKLKAKSGTYAEAEEIVSIVLKVFLDEKPGTTVSRRDKSLYSTIAQELYDDPAFRNLR